MCVQLVATFYLDFKLLLFCALKSIIRTLKDSLSAGGCENWCVVLHDENRLRVF